MSDLPADKPSLQVRQGGVLALSGLALVELLRAIVEKGAACRFRARGRSMSPFIREGDVVTVCPCAASAVKLGQVVAFVNPSTGRLAVHRVVGLGQDGCLIQGDNEACPDGWVPYHSILGLVTRVERNGRSVRLGIGPERIPIVYLNRRGWLRPLVKRMRQVAHLRLRLRNDAYGPKST